LTALWGKLDDLSRKAVSAALANDGPLDEDAFRAQYGRLPWDGAKRKNQWSYERDYLPVDVIFHFGRIPPDIRPLLRPLAPPIEKFVLAGKDTLAEPERAELFVAETEEAALHDLAATLSLVAEGKAAVTPKGGQPTLATATKLAGRLLQGEYLPVEEEETTPDPVRAFGWLVLAQAAKLVKADGSKLALTPKGQKVLVQTEPAHLGDIFHKWVQANEFDELSRIAALKGLKGRRAHLTRPTQRKQRILEALAQCPAGQWIAIEEFFRAVRAWRCNFEVEASGYYHTNGLYVGTSWEYGYLSGFGQEAAWRGSQAQYILVCLWEYLATLGALDIAYSRPEVAQFDLGSMDGVSDDLYFSRYVGLQYFRVNPLGAYLLGLAKTYARPTPEGQRPVFMVTANAEVAVLHREQFTPNIRTLLERLAEPVSEGVYRLARERILVALETGLTVEAVTDFLAGKSAQPLPQTVQVFLDDVRRNSRALSEAGSAVFFQAADPALAMLLANDSVLRKFGLFAHDTTVVVPAEKEAAFRRRVKQLGYGIRRNSG
jgi:hypothetical protein